MKEISTEDFGHLRCEISNPPDDFPSIDIEVSNTSTGDLIFFKNGINLAYDRFPGVSVMDEGTNENVRFLAMQSKIIGAVDPDKLSYFVLKKMTSCAFVTMFLVSMLFHQESATELRCNSMLSET